MREKRCRKFLLTPEPGNSYTPTALRRKDKVVPTITSKTPIFILLVLFVCATVAQAQITPITGVDPGATSSAAPESQRGMGSPTVATQTAGNSINVMGSQSYTYMVPLLQLPGRNG